MIIVTVSRRSMRWKAGLKQRIWLFSSWAILVVDVRSRVETASPSSHWEAQMNMKPTGERQSPILGHWSESLNQPRAAIAIYLLFCLI